MTPDEFDAAARALPAVTLDIQWGDRRVYKVGGRIFAITDGAARELSLKVSDIAFEALVESGRARPAPYLARAGWVAFDDLAGLESAEVIDWLATAHALVAARLTRRARQELGLVSPD